MSYHLTKPIAHNPATMWEYSLIYLGAWPCNANLTVRIDSDYDKLERSGGLQKLHNKLIRIADCLLADYSANQRIYASVIQDGINFLCANKLTRNYWLEKAYQHVHLRPAIGRCEALTEFLINLVRQSLPAFKTYPIYDARSEKINGFFHNGWYTASVKMAAQGPDHTYFKDLVYAIHQTTKAITPPWAMGDSTAASAQRHAQFCLKAVLPLYAEQVELVLNGSDPGLIAFYSCRV